MNGDILTDLEVELQHEVDKLNKEILALKNELITANSVADGLLRALGEREKNVR